MAEPKDPNAKPTAKPAEAKPEAPKAAPAEAKPEASSKAFDKTSRMLSEVITKVLAPAITVVAGFLGLLAALTAIVNSALGAVILTRAFELLELTGVLALKGVKEVRDHWDDIVVAFSDAKSWLLWRLGIVLVAVITLILVAVVFVAMGHEVLGATMIMILALVFFLVGLMVQKALPKNNGEESWAMACSRPFSILAVVTFFIATMILVMPTNLSNPLTIAAIIGAVGLGAGYHLLLGIKSNAFYHALFLIGVLMVVYSIVARISPEPVKNLFNASYQATLSYVGHTSHAVNSSRLKKFKTREEIADVINGDGSAVGKVKPNSIVLVDEASGKRIGSYPFDYFWVQQLGGGKVLVEGYYPSDLLDVVEELKKEEPKPETVSATPAPMPTSSTVPATSAPATTPAVQSDDIHKDQSFVEVGHDWTDTGIVLQPGDECTWFEAEDQENGVAMPCSKELLKNMEFIFSRAELIKPPASNLRPGINEWGNGFVGMCHVRNANKNNDHLFVRIADKSFDKVWMSFVVTRGARHNNT